MSYEAGSFGSHALLPSISTLPQASSRTALGFPGVRLIPTAAYAITGALLVLAILALVATCLYGVTMIHD